MPVGISEESLNKFVKGEKITQVALYPDAVHLFLENRAIITFTATDDGIDIGLVGAEDETPLRELWDQDVEVLDE